MLGAEVGLLPVVVPVEVPQVNNLLNGPLPMLAVG